MKSGIHLLALGLPVCVACAEPETGHPPVARISCQTSNSKSHCYLLPEDNFNTKVFLDGSLSSDPIDDPKGESGLAFAWELPPNLVEMVDGALDQAKVTLSANGKTPIVVRLHVTDASGSTATAERIIGITIPANASAP